MKLIDLLENDSIIVQVIWGSQKVEFNTKVLSKDNDSIYVNAYLHNGEPLEVNINHESGVVCNIFADDVINKQRVSWKNVIVNSVRQADNVIYKMKTDGYNNMSKNDDRRLHRRTIIHKPGFLFDAQKETYTDIIIHDISDDGISFYVSSKYTLSNPQQTVIFTDAFDHKEYKIKVNCVICRTINKAGNVFHGCKIVGENKDYLIYSFMRRLKSE